MKRKIYFAGSISGGRGDKKLYQLLIRHLAAYGTVLTEHIGDQSMTKLGEDGFSDSEIYQRDVSWIREADIVVAEVSTPSLGVGYEIGQAEVMNKPILCLYQNRENHRLSAMIAGNPRLVVVRYESSEDVINNIDTFFDSLK